MALQIKHDDGDGGDSKDIEMTGWQYSSTAREEDGADDPSKEPEFNPAQEFDTFKVPDGVEMDKRELTAGLNPGLHVEAPNETKPKLIKIGIALLVVAIIILIFKLVLFPAPKDLTADRGLDEKQLAAKYGITFERNEDMDKYMPQWTDKRTITVNEGKDLCTIYIDGQYKGFHFDSRKYTFGGLKIGDPEIKMFELVTFPYDEDYQVINDMMGGDSEADYLVNYATNECLVLTVSDKSNRIVAITYYNDAATVLETLEGLD